ncbi:MAG: hypothetical protein ABW321_02690 [Polyangiales bacterium]
MARELELRFPWCTVALLCVGACGADGADTSASRGATGDGANPMPGLVAEAAPVGGPTVIMKAPAACSPRCTDFPATPIFDDGGGAPPPSDAARFFGDPKSWKPEGGPCVLEPQLSNGDVPGSMFPSNWLRPRFRWAAAGSENLWELRITAQNQVNPLVVYTTRTVWAMPREMWKFLALDSSDMPLTVTIRGVDTRAPQEPKGARGDFTIAPAEAQGKLVYWAATSSEVRPDTSKLVGFDVGDEGVIDALTIPGIDDRGIVAAGGRELRGKYDDPRGVAAGHVQCIGCHVSTPDGDAVAFTDHWPWNNVMASVEEGTVGQAPSYLTPGAAFLLNQPWLGMQTFSKSHFRAGDRVLVSVYSPRNKERGGVGFSDGAPYPSRNDGLAWFDLETTASFAPADSSRGDVQQQLNDQVVAQVGQAFGLLRLDGEKRSVVAPHFSHDGTRIVYTSADATQDGRISYNNTEVDLHVVPFADRQGGTVTPLAGASEPGVAEYYPSFSFDDSLIAFNRVAKIDGGPIYYRPDGEIYVVNGKGGEPARLLANDPPQCSGEKSPGVINSWAKWSPSATTVESINPEFGPPRRTYYWLVFSSARKYEGQFELPQSLGDKRASQLYVTPVVRETESGNIVSYPAIYIWNQDPKTSNLTPAWDDFKIPAVPGPD